MSPAARDIFRKAARRRVAQVRRQPWMLARHMVTRQELRVLHEVSMLGRISPSNQYFFILNAIRHAIEEEFWLTAHFWAREADHHLVRGVRRAMSAKWLCRRRSGVGAA
jgi:hypothetical protein